MDPRLQSSLEALDARLVQNRARRDLKGEAQVHAERAEVLTVAGDYAEAAAAMGRAAAAADDAGDFSTRAQYLYGEALLLGRLPKQEEQAERLLRRAAALARVTKQPVLEVKSLARVAEVAVSRGDWEEGLAAIDAATAVAADHEEEPLLLVEMLRKRSAWLQGKGRTDRALDDLGHALVIAERLGDDKLALQLRFERRVLQDFTIAERPTESFAALLAEAEAKGLGGMASDIRLQRASAAARAGDYATALVDAEAARQAALTAPDPFKYVLACLLIAEALERSGDFAGVIGILLTCKKTLDAHLGPEAGRAVVAVLDSLERRWGREARDEALRLYREQIRQRVGEA